MTKFFVKLGAAESAVWQEGEDVPEIADEVLFAEWDGIVANVKVVRGAIPASGIPFLGWPQK